MLAFLLTTKVWSPQYSIWLVPLVALARPRWRLNLVWQFARSAVWIATLLWLLGFNDTDRGIDYGWLMLVLLVRDALLIAIAVLVSARSGTPSSTSCALDPLEDPAGGPFDGAADHPIALACRARCRPPATDWPSAGDVDPAAATERPAGLRARTAGRLIEPTPSAARR